jgi:Methylamine utilisation protein MauE
MTLNMPIRTGIRFFFVLLLAASAIAKFADMGGFADVVVTYDVLLPAFVPAAAWTLTLVEITLAVWLLVGFYKQAAAFSLVLLHLVYLGWLLAALIRDLNIPNCGCFGVYFARPLTVLTLIEDLGLLGLSLVLLSRTK